MVKMHAYILIYMFLIIALPSAAFIGGVYIGGVDSGDANNNDDIARDTLELTWWAENQTIGYFHSSCPGQSTAGDTSCSVIPIDCQENCVVNTIRGHYCMDGDEPWTRIVNRSTWTLENNCIGDNPFPITYDSPASLIVLHPSGTLINPGGLPGGIR